ncbi:RNA-directed DNA polymerase from mobile element jockey [Trichonephila clavipes]|nr:RNA-directed DNA polymerase from mobile element jockey [Trichonephila clavipes]
MTLNLDSKLDNGMDQSRYPHLTIQHDLELPRKPIANDSRTSPLTSKNLETVLHINSNCVIFGDFNATLNTWNCSHNSTRGIQLKNFADSTNLEIAIPNSPTRYGYNPSNTLDFALISNFICPYNIASIYELSSNHNRVLCYPFATRTRAGPIQQMTASFPAILVNHQSDSSTSPDDCIIPCHPHLSHPDSTASITKSGVNSTRCYPDRQDCRSR